MNTTRHSREALLVMRQRVHRFAAALVRWTLAVMLVSWWGALSAVHAQGGSRTDTLSWYDAPLVPRQRSLADWWVAAGWKTLDEVYSPLPEQAYEAGDTESFVPLGGMLPQDFVMHLRSEHAYFWFEPGMAVDPEELAETAEFFETRVFPLGQHMYVGLSGPGLDDKRIHVINQAFIAPGVLGAFNPMDTCPQSLCPESNQRIILYLNLQDAPLNSIEYLTTLTHEHQHLIQHYVDGNEQRWLNEGLSQLAEHLNGFAPDVIAENNMTSFLRDPDHHLSGWARIGEQSRYYGAGYLFLVYLYERFGLEFVQHLASTDYDGLAAVQRALAATGGVKNIDDIFADWILANLLDDPYVAQGQYYYQSLDLPQRIWPERLDMSQGEQVYSSTVNQYGADYLQITEPGEYQLSFDGSDVAPVTDTEPHSDTWMWWSYNNNSSVARLTAAFDLSHLESATLEFSAWWQMELNNDWFQVLVSDNDGQNWTIATGRHMIRQGPQAPGAYYSGHSQVWITEYIDLSDFTGGPVQLRFEYVTDGSDTRQGVALDDIRIPELDYEDDVESAFSRWQPEGFLRIGETVAQNWSLALVTEREGVSATVQALALDELHTGRTVLTVPPGGAVTLVIGAMGPFTDIPARYKLSVQRTG